MLYYIDEIKIEFLSFELVLEIEEEVLVDNYKNERKAIHEKKVCDLITHVLGNRDPDLFLNIFYLT